MLIKRSNIIDVRDNGGRGIMKILDHQGRILWEKRHPTPQFDDHDPLTIVKTDEGKLLYNPTNGITTTYVCELMEEGYENDWIEIDE